jgi:hypothetical protein
MRSSTRSSIAALAGAALLTLAGSAVRADLDDCGQPITTGPAATASDCLFLLRASVGNETCEVPCICDVDRSGVTSATDALVCLRIAVGSPGEKTCYCPYAQINITLAGGGTAPMLATETAGAPGVNDDNWNNLSGTLDAGGPLDLSDGDGTAITAAMVSYARVGAGILNDGGGTDDGHMFSSNIDAFDYPAFDVAVTGIPYPRYDVYAYHQGGAPAGLRRVARFTIGDRDLFAVRPESFAYSQSTATSDVGSSTQVGNYVVFRDLTASSFTLTVGGGSASDGFRRNRFAGFQVVAVELTP